MLARWVGCLARGDDRDGDRTSLAPDPDGSWPLQEARQRRDQRDAAQLLATLAAEDGPGEDLRALALSLADSALTSDGMPCSQQLGTEREQAAGSTPIPAIADEPDHQPPTADQIIHALQDDEPDRPPAGDGDGVPALASGWSQRPASASRRRVRARARWLIAAAITAASAGVLALTVASGSGGRAARHSAHQPRAAAIATALPASRLTTAAASIILAAVHGTDRTPTPRHRQRHHPARTRHSSPRVSTRHRAREHAATDNTSTATAPSTTTPPPTVTTPAAASTSGGSSTSGPSGASPPPAATAPRTTSTQRSQTPSKATLRSLIDGAGRCTC